MQDNNPPEEQQPTINKFVNVQMPSLEAIGQGLAEGATSTFAKWFGIGFALVIALTIVRNAFDLGVDSTDLNGWNRSGLTLHTDHGTGVQYLSDGKGGLIRREAR